MVSNSSCKYLLKPSEYGYNMDILKNVGRKQRVDHIASIEWRITHYAYILGKYTKAREIFRPAVSNSKASGKADVTTLYQSIYNQSNTNTTWISQTEKYTIDPSLYTDAHNGHRPH